MLHRVYIVIRGAVQGVGFRPFVFRLATELGLHGWVLNSPEGVFVDVEGAHAAVESLLTRLEPEAPARARIQSLEYSFRDPAGYGIFEIRQSVGRGEKNTLILPDIATCPDCLRDIVTPGDRRYAYPFTNCTNCGPRFSIIEALPYDRPNTSMKLFPMCPECLAEYENPRDRRFHAQPTACPACGPQVALWDGDGRLRATAREAMAGAAALLSAGRIIAVKGIGGFHLMVDARDAGAVARLRGRKRREEKPFALMAPHMEWINSVCNVSPLERRLLTSPEAPIVLLRKRDGGMPLPIPDNVAPRNPWLGWMLPSNPLHFLLMREIGFPVIATSGNISDEPICTDEHEALSRLNGIADAFLVHNRPIARHGDDSIVRFLLGRELVLRRARGYAPLPVSVRSPLEPMLAVGAHLKNSIAIGRQNNIFISQHIGDLETAQSLDAFRKTVASFQELYQLAPVTVVSDMHPDYISTSEAKALGVKHRAVQHHLAHVAACMAENDLDAPLLGVAWDGTGWGPDGSIWGGEFFRIEREGIRRVATFFPFSLPGGEAALREPRRSALGMLYAAMGDRAFTTVDIPSVSTLSDRERALLHTMLARNINSPVTSSVGRLFDGVASILGLRQRSAFEGQAAMDVEFSVDDPHPGRPFSFGILPSSSGDGLLMLDWRPALMEILAALRDHRTVSEISLRFHSTLAHIVLHVARAMGERRIAVSGGCFQNVVLTTLTVSLLQQEGFLPYWHQRVPPNDGGIALGQIYAAQVLAPLGMKTGKEVLVS